jgi:anti-sigma B factor antagonist
MFENSNFNIIIDNNEPTTGTIILGKSVLGGPEAIQFREIVAGFIKSGGQMLYADLTEVEIMNSTGLGMLISAYSAMKQGGRNFKLINIPEKVTKLLKLTKLETVLI